MLIISTAVSITSNPKNKDTHQLNSPKHQSEVTAPQVSVIMPSYNARAFIGDSIRSVLSQDYANIELIVIDDGSNDGTPEVVQEFGNRVTLLNQSNAGPAAARNRGMAAATGDLIAFLDADDVWLPGKVAAQVQYLQNHPEVGVVFGGHLRWNCQSDGVFAAPPAPINLDKAEQLISQRSGWLYTALLFDSVIHIITAMIRRSVIESVGNMDESLRTGEDYDFWLRVSRQFRIDELDRTLAYYRIHATSTTQLPRKENNEYKVLLRTLTTYGCAGPNNVPVNTQALRMRLFQMCFSHGYLHIRAGDPKVAQEAFRAAFHYAPFKPKIWFYWIWALLKQ